MQHFIPSNVSFWLFHLVDLSVELLSCPGSMIRFQLYEHPANNPSETFRIIVLKLSFVNEISIWPLHLYHMEKGVPSLHG